MEHTLVAEVVGRALLARISVKTMGVTIAYGSYVQTGVVTQADLCSEPQST